MGSCPPGNTLFHDHTPPHHRRGMGGAMTVGMAAYGFSTTYVILMMSHDPAAGTSPRVFPYIVENHM